MWGSRPSDRCGGGGAVRRLRAPLGPGAGTCPPGRPCGLRPHRAATRPASPRIRDTSEKAPGRSLPQGLPAAPDTEEENRCSAGPGGVPDAALPDATRQGNGRGIGAPCQVRAGTVRVVQAAVPGGRGGCPGRRVAPRGRWCGARPCEGMPHQCPARREVDSRAQRGGWHGSRSTLRVSPPERGLS